MKLHKTNNKQDYHLIILQNNKTPIKIIFKIIGAADAAANLLCEFKIAEKNDAKLIKNKKGNVILVKVIANSIFSIIFNKPGAIIDTNAGINICNNKY